jgi:FtsZ-binding cell division protein ZapB
MIPSYKEEVKITVVDQKAVDDRDLLSQIAELKEQVRQLSEMVNYIDRERSRIKSDLDSVKSIISKK